MTLPKWVDEWTCNCGDGDHDKLIKALAIALEALEKYKNGYDNAEVAEDALAEIERMGDK